MWNGVSSMYTAVFTFIEVENKKLAEEGKCF